MVSADPFDGARRRIASGRKHLGNLERELRAYAASGPHSVVFEPDTDPGWSLVKIKLTKAIPVSVEEGVFDTLGNLRSALDYATYTTAILNNKGDTTQANFPFGNNLANVCGQASTKGRGGYSKDIPSMIFDFCVGLKPYKGGEDFLWSLNRTWN